MNKVRTLKHCLLGTVVAVVVGSHSLFGQGMDISSLRGYWESDEFKKSFLGSYGINSDIEPRINNADEQEFLAEVRPLIFDEPQEAITKLERFIDEDTSALFIFMIGALQFQEGNVEPAIEYYRKAIEAFPNYQRAHQNLGVVFVQEERYEEALTHLTKAIELGAANASLYGSLGLAYVYLGQNISAETCFRNAMVLSPKTEIYKMGLAQSLIGQEKYPEAIAMFDELIAANPESASLWNTQAEVYVQLEELPKAVVNYEILRKMGKAQPRTLMLLGDIYMMQESTDLALPVYLEAIEAGEGDSATRPLRAAGILVDQGFYNEAKSLFAKIKEIFGDGLSEEEKMKFQKLEAKVFLAEGENESAVKILEEITKTNPLDGEALLMIGDYYAESENEDKAITNYTYASRVEGFEADAKVKLAQMHVQESEYQDAIALLNEAQRIRPRANIQKYLENVERVFRNVN